MNRRVIGGVAIAVLLLAVAGGWWWHRTAIRQRQPLRDGVDGAFPSGDAGSHVRDEGIGGFSGERAWGDASLRTFRSDGEFEALPNSDRRIAGGTPLGHRIGASPAVNSDCNPATRRIAESLRGGAAPHRLTHFIAPDPFDRHRFGADPRPYLDSVEPGRVFQSALPGPEVVPLLRLGPRFLLALQGEVATLRVRGHPGVPVTFYTPRLGEFENRLTSITVQANREGVAAAHLKLTTGTVGAIDVLASSPLHSGQASFTIEVRLPPAIVRLDETGQRQTPGAGDRHQKSQ